MFQNLKKLLWKIFFNYKNNLKNKEISVNQDLKN